MPKERRPAELDDLLDDFVKGLFVGRLRSKWFYWKFAYYLVLGVLFWLIAFELGANYFSFGKTSRLGAADFIPEVEQYCLPVVRAMKEFQRDNGRLPNGMEELIPRYLPDQSKKAVQLHGASQGQFEYHGGYHHKIWYDFTPGNEGWMISGPYVSGRIPLPPVKAGPATKPTTQTN